MRDGVIAPAPGARVRLYDPWSESERPYQTLIELVADPIALKGPWEQPKLVEGVLNWCKRYGLLGTVLHRLVSVTTAPRWRRLEFADKKKRNYFVPEQATHLQVPGGWRTQVVQYSSTVTHDPRCLNTALAHEDLPPEAKETGVVLVDLPDMSSDGGLLKRQRLDQTWSKYFPHVPLFEQSTYAYPSPATSEFWNAYGEPIFEFVAAAWLLKDAVDAIYRPARRGAREQGAHRLTALAACSSPGLVKRPDGTFGQSWVAGSLLSSLALMAMDDIASKELHECPTCRKLFLSTAYQAEYCSPTCRFTMQKRRHRGRLRTRTA